MKWTIIALTLLLPLLAAGQEERIEFAKANDLYRTAEFRKAVTAYEGIAAGGYESPALYYNLGNAYYKLQNYPAAILSYERARRLAPHDDDILYNLRLANLRIIDKIDPVPQLFLLEWWKLFVNQASSSWWATGAVVALWAAALLAAVFRIARSGLLRRIAFFGATLCVLAAAVAYTAMSQRLGAERYSESAIVFAESVPVKSAPDAKSTDLFVLHEGVKVELLDAVGEWRKIRLVDGKVGWLTLPAVQII